MPPLFCDDTISAISTPPGEGGVGIVRLSGPRSLEIAAGIFRSSRGRDILKGGQRVYHGHVIDETGRPVDEVLLHVMRGPHSYTAEDVVEINGHGGRAPLQEILEATLRKGARLAGPGEFTRRAFLNGRMDLTQAEAVMDLVQAKTRAALRAAELAASGGLAKDLQSMQGRLKNALARIEAAVDFPEEDLPELVTPGLFRDIGGVRSEMERLIGGADTGLLLREGVAIAILGRPNVGKSSLFNALLRDSRAIVSPEPGTTRDRIEETINLGGIPIRLCDTAGLRETGHSVESQGIERARQAARHAALLIFVVDASVPETGEDLALAREFQRMEIPVALVLNKIDLPEAGPKSLDGLSPAAVCRVSAVTSQGMEDLEQTLVSLIAGDLGSAMDTPTLFRTHQKDSMMRALKCLNGLLENQEASPEILAMDLRDALAALGEITGETSSEELLDIIFNAFCIGK